MTLASLQDRFVLGFVTAHLVYAALLVVAFVFRLFDLSAFVTIAGLTFPLFVGYATGALRYHLVPSERTAQHRRIAEVQNVSRVQSYFVCIVPVLFVLLVVALVAVFAFNLSTWGVDALAQVIAVVESAFAVFLGIVMQSLYGADAIEWRQPSQQELPKTK